MTKAWFTSFLLALCCNRKCIWNDLYARSYAGIEKVLFLRSYTRPNHFICTSSCNTTQAKRCEPGLTWKCLTSIQHNIVRILREITTSPNSGEVSLLPLQCVPGPYFSRFRTSVSASCSMHVAKNRSRDEANGCRFWNIFSARISTAKSDSQ